MLARTPDPVRLADAAPGALTGRAGETSAVLRMLDGEKLVTLTGLPGVGKTAVGLAVAAAAAGNFADGAAIIRLDALRDEALLPHSIVAALRLPDEFTRSPLQVLVEALQDRHMLLVFETCEHLLGACAALCATLLQLCPKVQILATSREPLRVPGESALSIRPLRLGDAMTLFSRRAAQASIAIAPEACATVASICVQLDKLPLAIDLAVRELGSMAPGPDEACGDPARRPAPVASLTRLLAALETDYDMLRDPGNPVRRHRSLRAAIGWSHELCAPAERLLWARLSVFTGAFRPRDAQDVCTTSQLADEAVAAGLALLTEKSVLLTEEGTDDIRRFLLPGTLRAYGHQMLSRLAQDAEFDDRYHCWQDGRPGGSGSRPSAGR
jgi:predicted ATPase